MEAVTDLETETQTGGFTPVLVAQINTEPVPSEVPRATIYGTATIASIILADI